MMHGMRAVSKTRDSSYIRVDFCRLNSFPKVKIPLHFDISSKIQGQTKVDV